MGANTFRSFLSTIITPARRMPAIRRNKPLRHVVEASNSNPAAAAVIVYSPDPYPSDGPGVNYLVTRDLVVEVDDYEHGLIDYQTLIARREIKWGETQDFYQRQHGYTKCLSMYRHEWKAPYTTPERKLTVVQSIWCKTTRALRADRAPSVLATSGTLNMLVVYR
ncbi:hypothetical protein DFH08DRAFT_818967 [Mycena albidolilacea]|uniref:Uncharacterized protein n=1 Tax=Mycena albidolilacea TaxID=1033008 RepID=A0AAD6ZF52_9AGAR|nr:hypothetical protein DFH08DRAFT_818967 [Mycena albidolilacea]